MKLAVWILLIISNSSWSYPIYYKCEAGGRLSDQITPPELAKKLKAISNLTARNKEKAIAEICAGSALCMNDLQNLMAMSETAGSLSAELIKKSLGKIKSSSKKLADEIFAAGIKNRQLTEHVALARECRVESARLQPDSMKFYSRYCILANFGHSPYMYPSGIRESGVEGKGVSSSAPVECSSIKDLVEGALATDQDPYAALAISLMENGTAIASLYLDPIGVVKTLGCSTTRGTREKHNLNSFGTYYNVDNKVVQNDQLLKKIGNYLKIKGQEVKPGESYYCSEGKDGGFGNHFISQTPQADRCCLKLPYDYKDRHQWYGEVKNATTYSSLENYVNTPLSGREASTDPLEIPARKLQRFNGYSDSMGGAERVSVWRSGVNYFKTPAYGYQAMDFILNTLWNNPFVRSSVEAAEKKLNVKSTSVLCHDVPPGVYSIEHDYYFNKHANSPRMESMLARFDKGGWKALPKRDKKVFMGEMDLVCYKKQFTESEGCKSYFMKAMDENEDLSAAVIFYKKNIHPLRRTVAQANEMDQGFKWKNMSDKDFSAFLKSYKSEIINSYR